MSEFTRDELHLIAVSGRIWLQVLESREKRLLNKIHGSVRAGDHNQLANLAEFASLRDQMHEIRTAIDQYQNMKGDL